MTIESADLGVEGRRLDVRREGRALPRYARAYLKVIGSNPQAVLDALQA